MNGDMGTDNQNDQGTGTGNDTGNQTEDQARRAGWVPLEDFRGDPARWVDADQFMERAESQLPIMKGTLRTMNEKMASQERLIKQQTADIEKLKNTMTDFVEFSRGTHERAYKKAMDDLKAQQRAAAEAGDVAAFDKVSREIDDHISHHPAMTGEKAKTTATDTTVDKDSPAAKWLQPGVFETWVDDNPWYEEEPQMTVYAQQMDRRLSRTEPELTQRQRLKKIAELTKRKFPDYFGNGTKADVDTDTGTDTGRPRTSAVEGSTGSASAPGKGKKGYANLPPEARAQCDEWAGRDGKGTSGTIPKFTRDQYVKDYFGE